MRARLASGNPHKLVELQQALPGWELELIDDPAFPTRSRLHLRRERSRQGPARSRRRPAEAWVIGEDSGIEASGLGGWPGIASARSAEDGIGRLLDELADVPDRRARYVCTIVAIGPGGEEIVVEGALEERSRAAPAAARASATTRSSCSTARSGRLPSSVMPGKRRTRTGPGPPLHCIVRRVRESAKAGCPREAPPGGPSRGPHTCRSLE